MVTGNSANKDNSGARKIQVYEPANLPIAVEMVDQLLDVDHSFALQFPLTHYFPAFAPRLPQARQISATEGLT